MSAKKRNTLGYTFVHFPRHMINSQEFANLSSKAVKLLCDIIAQYTGGNNGNFCVTWSFMQKRGWKSRDSLAKALKELEDKGFIEKTRQGGKNRCSLYAVSWRPIDECNGKLDCRSTTTASNAWRINTP